MAPREPISKLVAKMAKAYWEYSAQTPNISAMEAVAAIALEEAAKACEAELVGSFDQYSLGYNDGCKENAAAIRGMMEKKDV